MMQVFQTDNPSRWKKFKWTFRLLLALFFIAAIVFLISIYSDDLAALPKLSGKTFFGSDNQPVIKDKSVYFNPTRYNEFKKDKDTLRDSIEHPFTFDIHKLDKKHHSGKQDIIKAAFYVNWDLQSYYSLRDNIGALNTIFPEWFMINNTSDSISVAIDNKALLVMRAHNVNIIPMLSNFFNEKWDGKNVHRIISDSINRQKIITSILFNLNKYGFHGINIDFEDLEEKTDENMILFQKKLYEELHKNNFIVTQDIPPGNADYNLEELTKYNDYLVIMAYDQHYATGEPGPVASIKWIESMMDKISNDVDPSKLILGLCCYGYDWSENQPGIDISFQKAISTASAQHCVPHFDNTSYSLNYEYKDKQGINHSVFFNDAVSIFNTMRLGYEYHVGGFAAWRMGAEDARLWDFYNKPLDRNYISEMKPYQDALKNVNTKNSVIYKGEGELFDVVSTPTQGIVSTESDSVDKLISEENYEKLPVGYMINKFGKVSGKKVVLSFDDGPDEKYTPRIIEILKKENIPASFFLLGENAENNIPIVKKLFENNFELGNHSFSHPNFSAVSALRIKLELRTTKRLIECITGRSTILFRFPYSGDDDSESVDDIYPMWVSKTEHYYTVGSAVDPRDWEKNIKSDEILKRVIEHQHHGNIILLHDGGGNREETIKALPLIIKYFKDNGYTFTTVADIIGKTKNDVMPPDLSQKEKLTNSVNYFIASFIFYANKILLSLFLFGILLVMLRLLFIIVLALVQKVKTKQNKTISNEAVNSLVSVIVPAFNEEATILKTVQTLLSSHHKNIEIVIVDDASTDDTYKILKDNFAGEPRVKLFSKTNGGKASALNFGIANASAEIVLCIDADTQLRSNAIDELIKYFDDVHVAAVAGNVKIGNEVNWITKWQSIEYITGQNFDRRAFDLLDCITIVPGAIGAFRKNVLVISGGFPVDTLAEDCDLTIRILEQGYTVRYSAEALAYTEAPESIKMFLKQRFRWTFGIMQSFWKHRSNFLNYKSGTLGFIAMPNMLLFQFILPAIAPAADLIMILSFVEGRASQILSYYILFMAIDAAGTILAFSFEKENIKRLWHLIPQRIVFRQLMGFILYKSLLKAAKGELMSWGQLKRSGNVDIVTNVSEFKEQRV